MQSGPWSRKVRICMEDLKIETSLNSLGLQLVEGQEKRGIITSYLAGIIMLQFVPFGKKKKKFRIFLNWIGDSGL